MPDVVALGRDALATALVLALPVMLVSLVVGTVVGILQAMFQVQEPTVSFVPKMLVAVLAVMLSGPALLRIAAGLLRRALEP